jgi:MOB kinase activator 1
MGNKGSKGGDSEGSDTPQTQQPSQQTAVGQQTPANGQPPIATMTTLKPSHAAEGSIQQSTTTTATTASKAQPQGALEVGLAEFGTNENISAQESYNHWDTAAQQTGNADNIGPAKTRNKELEKTMRQTMRNTMCNGDLRQLVKLPPNADANEWIALNTIHFYRTCSQIGETYRELCTPQTCPLMSAGNVEYLWKDDKEYPKPTRVPACMYMEYALRDAYLTIEDTNVFPSDDTQAFPKIFLSKVKEIFKRLFRQFAHLYYSHYDQVKQGGSSKHLNSTFKHFIYFVLEFALIDQQTLAPLQKFIDHIIQQNPGQ